jgi:PTH1 family peptidyl-tRNA hydrolase
VGFGLPYGYGKTMKLVVGLGNPGRRYAGTRHNIGYAVLGELGRRFGAGKYKTRFQGEVMEAELGGQRALLLSPTTYMNLSGASVLEARDFYKLQQEDLLVLCDDLNLPLGKLRVRAQGSSGGQKGMEDIIRRLGSEAFSRLRVGIGTPPPGWDAADFVLARFTAEEQLLVDEAVQRAADAVVVWAREGVDGCMNRYNS